MNTPPMIHSLQSTPIPGESPGRVEADVHPTSENKALETRPIFLPEKIGHYQIHKLLGKGGMGSVYLGEDTLLHRKVAIKTLRVDLAENEIAKERFLREARIVAGLKHDHIVTIYSVGEENGIPYFAMEYLEGYSLENVLQRKKKLTWHQILRLGREIARALAAAHAKGLIHRDVKPGNIWIEQAGGDKTKTKIKILDFGLARFTHQVAGPTLAGMVVGTPHYLSPEQARGKELDPRSDLFSLGVVLYRLATRAFPFDGTDTLSVLSALAIDSPPPISENRPDVIPEVEAFILQLLEKEPVDRPASAEEVANKLGELDRRVKDEEPRRTSSLGGLAPPGTRKVQSKSVTISQGHQRLLISLLITIAVLAIILILLLIIKVARGV